MESFILKENTKFFMLKKYDAEKFMDAIEKFIKEHPGCEILGWKQAGDGEGYLYLSIFYNTPNKELDDILK